jgi:hypothetical protein
VFATSERGTAAALQQASLLSPNIVLLVPRIVDHGAPLDGADDSTESKALADLYRDLASRAGVNASIRVCACRDARHLTGRLMLQTSRIVLGGRWKSWLSTPEQKLARELASEGHDITFVDHETGHTHHPGAVPA